MTETTPATDWSETSSSQSSFTDTDPVGTAASTSDNTAALTTTPGQQKTTLSTGQPWSGSNTQPSTRMSGTPVTTTQPPVAAGSALVDHNAIIAGAVFGLLLLAIVLAAVCLARARARRRRGAGGQVDDADSSSGRRRRRRDKTPPRPTPAAASAPGREPNPYTNACFDAGKEEMGEKDRQTKEPGKSASESVNSIRNKEDHWIIPLEELADNDTTSNFDTTRF